MKRLRVMVCLNGQTITVLSRGDARQTNDDIVERVKNRLSEHDGDRTSISVENVESLEPSVEEQPDSHEFEFDVHAHSESPYCPYYYGVGFQSDHTRARGPVGYSELE